MHRRILKLFTEKDHSAEYRTIFTEDSNNTACTLNLDHQESTLILQSFARNKAKIISVTNVGWLLSLMAQNENKKVWEYVLDFGIRKHADLDINSDEIKELVSKIKDAPGFHNLKWRFSNGYDIYGLKEDTRIEWLKDQLVDVKEENLIFNICNMSVVEYYKEHFPKAEVKYHNIWLAKWLHHNINVDYFVPNKNYRTRNVLCKNNLPKRHRSEIVSILGVFPTKCYYSYISEGIHLEETNAEDDITSKMYSEQEYYNDAYIYISTETFFYKENFLTYGGNYTEDDLDSLLEDYAFITEKTLLTALYELPVLIVGRPNSLKTWQKLGFETFPEFFNEEYDNEVNDTKRMLKVQQEVFKTIRTNTLDLHNLYWSEDVQRKLKHNKENFYRLLKEHPMWDYTLFNYNKGTNSQLDLIL